MTANRCNWAWPTTMVLFSPGPANLIIREAIPLSWESTVFRHTFFFDRPEGDLLPEQQAHIAMDGALQAEDTALVEGNGDVALSLRPEQITTAPGVCLTGLGAGVVTECHFNGTHVRCHLMAGRDGARPLAVHLPARAAVRPGDRLGLYIDPADVVVLAD